MKKIIIATSLLLCLILAGCNIASPANQNVSSDVISEASSEATTSNPVVSNPPTSESSPVESSPLESTVSEPSSSGITEEQALEIASKHWGIKSGDVDQETGFTFLIMPVQSENQNYRIALKWLVNNTNYSTVDMIEIDAVTGEIIEQ